MTAFLDPGSRWRTRTVGDVEIRDCGDAAPVDDVASAFSRGGRDAARQALYNAIGQFAGVLTSSRGTLAFVDHCRSIPLFYSEKSDAISNDAKALVQDKNARHPDIISVIEAAMSGYVTGRNTLF